MRIGMVAYTYYQGDNRVMRYAETLAQRGDQVDVISLRFSDKQSTVEVINGVTVLQIQTRSVRKESRWNYLFGTVLFLLRAMILLTRRHFEHRYQLLHVHSVPDFLIFSAWIPQLLGCKLILDIHDLLPEFYASKFGIKPRSLIYRFLLLEERMSAAISDHVIISNHLWYDRLVARAAGQQNCTAIINAVDRSIFRPGPKRKPDNKFIVLYPGTLNRHQGLDIAIQAISRLKNSAPGLELHICGTGPDYDVLVSLTRELGLEDRVLFLYPRPLRDIPELMRTADLGVVPKRKDMFGNEAFSTKILEFMASGIPVVAADTRIERYYYNESIVQFFEAGNEEDLARTLLELFNNRERCDYLARNAADFVRENDWQTNRHIYLDLVDNLTGNLPSQGEVREGALEL